jgi:hypothetical protein
MLTIAELLPILATGIALPAIAIAYFTALRLSRRAAGRLDRKLTSISAAITDIGPGQPELGIIDEPPIKAFLAFDEDQITSLYAQTPEALGGLLARDVETSASGEGSGVIKLPWVEAGGKKTKSRVIKERHEYKRSPLQAYEIVDSHLAGTRKVRQIDLTAQPSNRPIEGLIAGLHRNAESIGMTVNPDVVKSLEATWRTTARVSIDAKVRSLDGFVKIKADYEADYNDIGDLILRAPKDAKAKTHLTITIRRDWLVDGIGTELVPGCTIRAICFGHVGQVDETSGTLSVFPMAVYAI